MKDEIIGVVEELEKADAPLTLFIPDDVEKGYFLGEAAIIAAATIFLTAFMKGVKSSLEKKAESLGKTVTDWVIGKIEGLFRDSGKKPEADNKSLENEAKNINKLGAEKQELDKALASSQEMIADLLKEKGVLANRADQISEAIRKAAELLIKAQK
ncbi:MAG: hypothetical protein ACFFAJ_17820 [Candidatus Hodarchaeota archaeon]